MAEIVPAEARTVFFPAKLTLFFPSTSKMPRALFTDAPDADPWWVSNFASPSMRECTATDPPKSRLSSIFTAEFRAAFTTMTLPFTDRRLPPFFRCTAFKLFVS